MNDTVYINEAAGVADDGGIQVVIRMEGGKHPEWENVRDE